MAQSVAGCRSATALSRSSPPCLSNLSDQYAGWCVQAPASASLLLFT